MYHDNTKRLISYFYCIYENKQREFIFFHLRSLKQQFDLEKLQFCFPADWVESNYRPSAEPLTAAVIHPQPFLNHFILRFCIKPYCFSPFCLFIFIISHHFRAKAPLSWSQINGGFLCSSCRNVPLGFLFCDLVFYAQSKSCCCFYSCSSCQIWLCNDVQSEYLWTIFITVLFIAYFQ